MHGIHKGIVTAGGRMPVNTVHCNRRLKPAGRMVSRDVTITPRYQKHYTAVAAPPAAVAGDGSGSISYGGSNSRL